jgi:hypothetical protein
MSRLFEDFLSRKWNLYGLQLLAGSLMVMILHQYLTIFQLCIIGLCVYIIAICQRILGVSYGMLWSAFEVNKKKRIDSIVSEVKKIQKERKKGKGK